MKNLILPTKTLLVSTNSKNLPYVENCVESSSVSQWRFKSEVSKPPNPWQQWVEEVKKKKNDLVKECKEEKGDTFGKDQQKVEEEKSDDVPKKKEYPREDLTKVVRLRRSNSDILRSDVSRDILIKNRLQNFLPKKGTQPKVLPVIEDRHPNIGGQNRMLDRFMDNVKKQSLKNKKNLSKNNRFGETVKTNTNPLERNKNWQYRPTRPS